MKKSEKLNISEKQKNIIQDFAAYKKEVFLYVIIFLFMCAVGTSLYFYKEISTLKNDKQSTGNNEVAELISEVSKIILLPEGEVPTVATVSDPAELQGQPFFAKAKTGDKVLLYQTSRKAYLYDPVARKILEVSSITQ